MPVPQELMDFYTKVTQARGRDLYDRQRSRVAGYECAQCGFHVARTEDKAVEWLRDHQMLKERE